MEPIKKFISGLLAISINTALNVVDAITYGSLIFPVALSEFRGMESMGICIYLLSTGVSQMIISVLSSFGVGATSCLIIENVPLYHLIANKMMMVNNDFLGEHEIMPTLLVAFMLISLLVAVIFGFLAFCGLERIIHKVPRVLLVGCMGGIGLYLLQTALFHQPFGNRWVSVIALGAGVLVLGTELILGVQFAASIGALALFVLFYAIAIFGQSHDFHVLREAGWLVGRQTFQNPLSLYTKITVSNVNFSALFAALPTIVLTAMFACIHVPINIPSFARLTSQSFCMKTELRAQSITNFVAAFVGFAPTYFVYTNSLLFLRAGATSRTHGLMMGVATLAILLWGLEVVSWVPTPVTTMLIVYVGGVLVWEALIGCWWMAGWGEWGIIVFTCACMLIWGFVSCLIFGSVLTLIHHKHKLLTASKKKNKIKRHPEIVNVTRKTVKAPSQMAFFSQIMRKSHLICLPESLHFRNAIDYLSMFKFQIVDYDNLIIVDFGECLWMDLNFVEGFLGECEMIIAARSCGAEGDDGESVVIVVVGLKEVWDDRIAHCERLLGERVQFNRCSLEKWLETQFALLNNTATAVVDDNGADDHRHYNNNEYSSLLVGPPAEAKSDSMDRTKFIGEIDAYTKYKEIEKRLLKVPTPTIKLPKHARIQPGNFDNGTILVVEEGRVRDSLGTEFVAGAWIICNDGSSSAPALFVLSADVKIREFSNSNQPTTTREMHEYYLTAMNLL